MHTIADFRILNSKDRNFPGLSSHPGGNLIFSDLQHSSADLAISIDLIFVAGQFRKPHGATRMKLIGTDPDFSSHAELAAIGKTG